jgi:hypothetical protein
VSFAIVDVTLPSYPGNLRGMGFATEESGYMAGALAGMMTQSEVVGSVAGMQITPVEQFVEPYRHAAKCANPDVTALITYTGTFGDPDLGAQTAQEMITKSADVIFGAGGQTGTGGILTATQSGAWGIGVDLDQYLTAFEEGAVDGSEYLLSSAVKGLDVAVYETIADFVAAAFTSGTVIYDIADGATGLAPFHEAADAVPSTVRGRLARIRGDLVAHSIDFYGACPPYMEVAQETVTTGATAVLGAAGGLVELTVGPGTFAETAVVRITPLVPYEPGGKLVGTGLFYNLEMTSSSSGQPLAPQGSYSVTASYLDAEAEAAGVVDEGALALYYWDGGQWQREPTSQVDPRGNRILATPNHASVWAVLSPRYELFLPTVRGAP